MNRLPCGTWEPVASMRKERRKRKTRERLSTDARHRGGATRSSDEALVIDVERRGGHIRPGTPGQPSMGGFRWTRHNPANPS